MIARKTARLLAEAYVNTFGTFTTGTTNGRRFSNYEFRAEELNDFLYDETYDSWFLNMLKTTNLSSDTILKERIMSLHTGETFTWFETPYKDESPENRAHGGQEYLRRLAESLLRRFENEGRLVEASAPISTLKSHFELDGYVYKEGKLYAPESSVIDEQEEQTYLVMLVNTLQLPDPTTLKHHITLAEKNYVSKDWDDSISNSRKVLDAILTQVAARVYLKVNNKTVPPETLRNATDTRLFLERQKLLTTIEREVLGKTYGLLSATGGHPYIAEQDQARLMRHQALTLSQFVLLRYQGFLANNP